MKPLSTGSEMNEARNPMRSRPAARPRSPVTTASAAVICTNSSDPPCAKSPTMPTDSAAVADIEATTRWRDEPSSVYRTRAGTAAYSPTTGGTPAIVA